MAHNSTENAVGCAVKDFFGKILPSLGKVSKDTTRAIFSTAMRTGSALVTDT